MVELIEAGNPWPTAEQVAIHAGVSLRLVYQHFNDNESLMVQAGSFQAARILPLLNPVDPTLPRPERVMRLVASRDRLYQSIAAFRRAALLREPTSPTVARGLQEFRKFKRKQVIELFHVELDPMPAGLRVDVAAELALVASFSTWDELSRRQGLAREDVRRLMRRTLTSVLNDSVPGQAG